MSIVRSKQCQVLLVEAARAWIPGGPVSAKGRLGASATKLIAAGALGLGCFFQGALAHAATIVVDTSAPTTSTSVDDGQCSLAEAIQAANLDTAVDTCAAGLGRDVVVIPAGTYEFLLPYTSADSTLALPAITSEITLEGPATDSATFTFNSAVTTLSFLGVAGTGKLTVQGLTFSQAHGPNEIVNSGQLVVDGCTFQGNGNAGAPAGHTCIRNRPAATLSVVGSRFVSNQGGAIEQDDGVGSLSIESTEFIANYHTAIRVRSSGTVLTVEGSTFDQNAGRPPALYVLSGASATVTNSSFTDNASDNTFPGAILVDAAALSVVRSTFSGNRGHSGGAIHASVATSLSISHTTFAGNEATSQGGALSLVGGTGSISILNSTFSGNSTADLGGAIWTDLNKSVVLNNVTVADNTCRDGCGLFLRQGDTTGTFTLSNTIIAGNGERDCYTEGAKFLISAGHNLLGRGDACTMVEGDNDQVGTSAEPLDAGLAPLSDNGGPTQTHALLWDSAALDKGSPDTTGPGACEPSDQAGTLRPMGPACDIGAFEGSLAPPVTGEAGAGGAMDGTGGSAGGGPPVQPGSGGSMAEGGAPPMQSSAGGVPAEGGAPSTTSTSTSTTTSGAAVGAGGAEMVDGGVIHRAKTKEDSGCGCRLGSTQNPASTLSLMGLLGLVALRRRPRRQLGYAKRGRS